MHLRDELKRATRVAHARLEARLALDAPDLSRERYTCYLDCMLAFHRGIAQPLERARREWPGVPDCAVRIGWLEADLEHLGVECRRNAVPHHLLPMLPGTTEVAGCSYVLEGVSLGGRVLYAQLRDRWGLRPERGGSFLFGYGPRTAVRWKHFVDTINAVSLEEDGVQRCSKAAQQTFAALDAWFERNGWRIENTEQAASPAL